MRASHRLLNFYYSATEFIKNHAVRLMVLLVVFIIACALGIKSGCGADAGTVLESRRNYSLLVGTDSRSVVGFLFSEILFCLIIFLILSVTAFNFWVSCLGVVVFFYVVYTMGYTIAVYFSYFKLAALPYLIICYVPYCFIVSFAFACTIATAMDCGMDLRRLGYLCIDPVKERGLTFVVVGGIAFFGAVYGGALGGLLTMGLII